MRAWLAVATALLGVGCLVDQRSLQPLFRETELLRVPEIVGTWSAEGDDPMVLQISAAGGGIYELQSVERGRVEGRALLVGLGKIGDRLYWDATAKPSDDDGLWAEHTLPLHSIARVRIEENRLEIAPLDSDWLDQAVAERRVEVAHLRVDHGIVLTAATEDLQRLLLEHGEEDGAFAEPVVFARQRAGVP